MEEYQKEHESISFCYSQSDRSEYAMGRCDGLDDARSSMIDRTMNGSASGPLAGPSTNRAEAIEARALNMMAVPAAPTIKNRGQRARGIRQNVRKGLSNLVCSIVGSHTNRRQTDGVADMENTGLVQTFSDSSLVFVTAEDGAKSSPTSLQLHGSLCQRRGQFSTLGWQPECPPAESASDGTPPIPQIPQSYIGTDPLTTVQGVMSSEISPSTISHQQIASQGAPIKHHTQSPNYEQQSDIAAPANFVHDDDISVLELPPPPHYPRF
jgi:hypothetical protein